MKKRGRPMFSKLKIFLAYLILTILIGSGVFFVIYFSGGRGKYKVIATIFPIYDICRNVMGSSDDILLLEDSGADIHNFQPTSKDIAAVSKANVFIYIGGESDKWVGGTIRSAANRNLKTLCLINAIEALEESEQVVLEGDEEEHEHEEEHGEEEKEYDEHIWLSIKNMIEMTKSITNTLSLAFPEKQEIFRINSEEYIAKLQALDDMYTERIAGSEKTLVFADRFPFLYLTNDYNLKYIAAFSGCSAETEASPSTITKLIEKVNEENLNYICVLETTTGNIARAVQDGCDRDIGKLTINSCQSVSGKAVDTITYIDMMERNLYNLERALRNENN